MKTKINAMLLLDEIQLEESDSTSPRYAALDGVKKELTSAIEIMDCRLDLIEKADSSKIGWAAAVHYEKANGLVKKTESDKLWTEAEKSVTEARKKDRLTPFRSGPVSAGRNAFQYQQRTARGSSFFPRIFCFVFSYAFETG